MSEKACAGKCISGYWKGKKCGAHPSFQIDGKWWCKQHAPHPDPTADHQLEARVERVREFCRSIGPDMPLPAQMIAAQVIAMLDNGAKVGS